MDHKPEFDNAAEARKEAERKRRELANITARTYARVFSTDDGKAVLQDLQKKFSHTRPRFKDTDERHSTVTAALIDGQCAVLREIEAAITAGGGAI
jgi:hypothetical protein